MTYDEYIDSVKKDIRELLNDDFIDDNFIMLIDYFGLEVKDEFTYQEDIK